MREQIRGIGPNAAQVGTNAAVREIVNFDLQTGGMRETYLWGGSSAGPQKVQRANDV